ncbi:hypothetical protein M501DRAFT_1018807 [Patellaria atrata CBS 101060]|uniref:Serine hydrolase domain-containing protein n=1 Tax=Patellaria atrata CBS 101060 TaxID=1346257 RepID=A0A9P4S5L9_9PEZI|nr:hypothetical protein M501DRAFT_1018807 [Patellaria atrata CBS 101060]
MAQDAETGPWVGVLGFSQGAKVAASLLWEGQRLGMAKPAQETRDEDGLGDNEGTGSGVDESGPVTYINTTSVLPIPTLPTRTPFRFAALFAGRAPLVSLPSAPSTPSPPHPSIHLASALPGANTPSNPSPSDPLPEDIRLALPTLHIHGL